MQRRNKYSNSSSNNNRYRKPYQNNSRGRNNRRPSKQNINPKMFIKAAEEVEEAVYASSNTFEDFKFHQLIQRNIQSKGFVSPSPIQDQAIPISLSGRDIIGIANTGTGKTAAFALPLLHRILSDKNAKALVVAPTRELAQQIEEEFRSFAKGSGMHAALLIGGERMREQINELRCNPSIVIGTPGRIKDHIQRDNLNLSRFNNVVLDEADRMIDMGFIEDVRFLISRLNDERQSYFFSATLNPKLKKLIESFLNNPVTISVKTGDTNKNIEQNVIRYKNTDHKIDQLHDSLIHENTKKAIIFEETKRGVDSLHKELIGRGFKVDAIHGDKTQRQRQRSLDKFKAGKVSILVATDVASRGIDVRDITHVINYSTPQSYEDYVHRIGRAGRAGRRGYALTFVK